MNSIGNSNLIKDWLEMKNLVVLVFFLMSSQVLALVDYTENPAENRNVTKPRLPSKSSADTKGLAWKSDLSFSSNYEVSEIESQKYGAIILNTHFQTPFNIYFDLSYWNARSSSGSQNGNPKAIIGFNWIRFGAPSEEARLDLYGGAKISGNSDLASSRTDKIFGVETTKRFGSFGLGIGYDISVVGTPKKSNELAIGNINRITMSGGWIVSNDIEFELEAESFKVASGDDQLSNRLAKSISFSCLSPKLNLALAPAVNLELGARFRTKKATSEQDLKAAKLFDLHGAYTNSLFAGLNLTL